MPKFRVHSFTISLDGYGAGPGQSLEQPLGDGGLALHQWFFPTRTFQRMHGSGDGETGPDDNLAARGFDNVGAWILGRNMFGPVRGPWPDESWQGWWGDNPPCHTPVFVLTHHPRPTLEMAGGTTFHFVTGGVEEAAERALAAAGGQDVRVGGGVATVQQLLCAGLIDHLHLAIAPILLGAGEAFFAGVDLLKLGFRCQERVCTPKATHVVLTREAKS